MLGLHTSLHQFLFLAEKINSIGKSLEHILIEFHIEVGNQFRPEFPCYSAFITHSARVEIYILEDLFWKMLTEMFIRMQDVV